MNQKGFASIALIILLIILVGALGYVTLVKKQISAPASQSNTTQNTPTSIPSSQVLPTTCVDKAGSMPVITSLSAYSGSVGTMLEVRGCNFAGFEGDKNVWIENSQGGRGLLGGEIGSTSKFLKITLRSPLCEEDTSYSGLPCKVFLNLVPGIYKIYAAPWGKNSNEVNFEIR